jgi:hypothetical protein
VNMKRLLSGLGYVLLAGLVLMIASGALHLVGQVLIFIGSLLVRLPATWAS